MNLNSCTLYFLGLFHIELASFVLGRPIHIYSSKVHHRNSLFPCKLMASKLLGALYLAWVPAKFPASSCSHIVPAKCKEVGPLGLWRDKCGFHAIARCFLFVDETDWSMVLCDICGQWFHCLCMGVDEKALTRHVQWECGCREIASGLVTIEYLHIAEDFFYQYNKLLRLFCSPFECRLPPQPVLMVYSLL